MGKKYSLVSLYTPGLIIFDPVVLDDFLKCHGVTGSNIFSAFLENEVLGRAAIETGALLPIYQIPENEYFVFVKNSFAEGDGFSDIKFEYSGMPLCVESGVVIVADLNALLDWDSEFFINYKDNYSSRLPSNDYLEVAKNLYDVTIVGCRKIQGDIITLGYALEFSAVEVLPKVKPNTSIDDWDFSLYD